AAVSGQTIGDELVLEFAIAGASGEAQLAGGQIEQAALQVNLGDGLPHFGLGVDIRRDRFAAVGRDVGGTALHVEYVEAASAPAGDRAEAIVLRIAAVVEPLAEVRCGIDRPHPAETVHPGLA